MIGRLFRFSNCGLNNGLTKADIVKLNDLTIFGNYGFVQININEHIPVGRSITKIYAVDVWDHGGGIIPIPVSKNTIRFINITTTELTVETVNVHYEYLNSYL